jgi:Ca2+-binding RTX toxin-like protein
VRTADHPITAQNFGQATPLGGAPAPAQPGTRQSYAVSGSAKRYVAIRAVDDQGNVGRPAALRVPKASAPLCAHVITGTRKRDRLHGTSRSDRIRGRGGSDRISGGRGPDCISGGPGRDRLRGGRAADRIRGGRGRDFVVAGAGSDRIRAAGHGRDRVSCGPGRDTVFASRNDHVGQSCEAVHQR